MDNSFDKTANGGQGYVSKATNPGDLVMGKVSGKSTSKSSIGGLNIGLRVATGLNKLKKEASSVMNTIRS